MQLFVAFNVFIGVFNLLPLLPLDGGHVAIATYERIREGSSGRRHLIDTARLLPFTYAVVAFLAFFGLGAVYLDLANPLGF
jgi:membrane-associated protease RseP (regulator of RpoE activity)